jgi:hypothetical protein
LITIILSNSCCKDVNCPELTADDKSWIPYKENDTLVFKNFENDSVLIFYVYYKQEKELTSVANAGYGCTNQCIKGLEVGLITKTDVGFAKKLTYYIQRTDSDFYIISSPYEMSLTVEQGILMGAYFDYRESILVDTIIINNKIVFDVYKYETNNQSKDIRAMYIKKGLGILRIDFDNEQYFELIK